MTAPDRPRPRLTPARLWQLLRATWAEWNEDKVPRLGASLAYYTIFSIAPLLVIAIAIAGLVFNPAEVQQAVLSQLGGLVGPDGAEMIKTMLDGAQKPAAGIIATILGVIGLVLGALGAFGQLQDALNTIWEVKPKEGRGIKGIIQDRLLSLSMVLVVGFLLMVSLVVSTALSAVGNVVGGLLPESELLLSIVNFVISFLVITVLFALMFKYLPDAKIDWRDVWIGAAITALLFTLGKQLIGLYLGNSTTASSYGAAGSLVVLLLWVYYSAQIFLLGAEFTQVYANQFGSRVRPTENAEPVTPQDRAQQGLPHDAARQPGQPRPVTAAPAPAGLSHPGLPQPRELPHAGDGYLVSLLAFLTGLGAGAVLGGQNYVNPPVNKRKRR